LAEMHDSCTKHDLKIRFFLTVFSLQSIHLNSYIYFIYLVKKKIEEIKAIHGSEGANDLRCL